MKRNILITGGAGFIGSHVVRLFVNKYPEYHIINLDKLTYAGNLANLKDIEGQPNYTFVKADICDFERIIQLFKQYNIDSVIHLAAESHVDRSIKDPFIFAQTNVMGTLSLLQAAKLAWETSETGYDHKLFYHISTDEVYGALDFDGTFFTEQTKYQPHSPYSASKAGSDHFVRAFHDTYGMPVIVTNCSNNYGPYQFPEKLIPLFINNIRHGRGYYGVKQSRNKSKKTHVIPLIYRYFFDLISFISLTVKNLFLVHFCCTFVTRNKIIFITLTSEKPERGHKIETNKSI